MHRALYRQDLTLEEAKGRIGELAGTHPEAQQDVDLMINFLQASTRGIVR